MKDEGGGEQLKENRNTPEGKGGRNLREVGCEEKGKNGGGGVDRGLLLSEPDLPVRSISGNTAAAPISAAAEEIKTNDGGEEPRICPLPTDPLPLPRIQKTERANLHSE